MFWLIIIGMGLIWLTLPEDNNTWSLLDEKEDKQ